MSVVWDTVDITVYEPFVKRGLQNMLLARDYGTLFGNIEAKKRAILLKFLTPEGEFRGLARLRSYENFANKDKINQYQASMKFSREYPDSKHHPVTLAWFIV